ncbi:Ragulator complex protein LAMTOR3 [Piptocephalis cylindrospora]|uniref:Ragulator complex protein LAMTOR3 n=1 Tax=Piptocephalis cylindrospora TaxID=1907219 RepID=A0A4P9Y460_9FUNG|nr:Ragulator complex protein LAMTOR3 [Piptocephalis cylindrospora]|eukprot:RKP13717.1 Ragulator complex protein LAMTOR3 [Piptocephalis cylindrospora]
MSDITTDLQAQRKEELGRHFQELVSTSDGLHAAMLSDREGVQLTMAQGPDLPQDIIDPTLNATFSSTSGHASKLGIGKNHTITTLYGMYQVIQTASRGDSPGQLVITLIAEASANTGMLIDLAERLAEAIRPFSEALGEVE